MATAGIPYDQLTRFEGTRHALRGVVRERSDVRILDVGGFPCSFARYLAAEGEHWSVETADVVESQIDNYHHIEPGALPFAAGSFDYVVANDTLEHVAPNARREFLRELVRVARYGIVVAGPFHAASIASVEEVLSALHTEVRGSPHPWLAEHRSYGLPTLRETVEALASNKGQPPLRLVAAEPNAPIQSWLIWHWSHIARGVSERFAPMHEKWDALCCRTLMGRVPEDRTACYRRILVFAREGQPVVEPIITEDFSAPLLTEMLAAMLREAIRDGGGDRGEELLRAVDERLAASLALLEKQASCGKRRGLMGRLRGA